MTEFLVDDILYPNLKVVFFFNRTKPVSFLSSRRSVGRVLVAIYG